MPDGFVLSRNPDVRIGHGKSPSGILIQHPGPNFLSKAESVVAKRSGLGVGIDDLGLANVERSVRGRKDFHNGINRHLRRADAQKTVETHVFGCRFMLKLISVRVRVAELEGNPQAQAHAHAHFGSGGKAANFGELCKASAERIEVDGFLEVGKGAELLAVLFCLSTGLATDDDDGGLLGVAERSESLKKFIAGIIGHAKIEQDGIGLVFEREG